MHLVPFTAAHAATVAGWPVSDTETRWWCGARPPVEARTVAGWQQGDGVRARLLVVDDEPVGYGELWVDASDDEVELARLIVAPAARGRGLGRMLVRHLLAEAASTGLAMTVLRVHPDNTPAQRCYRGAGFEPVPPELAAEWNVGQPIDYVWMRTA